MNVCVIPARGGSKRIPRKNLRPFCGAPVISYSIATARASGCFDHVIVSTEDDEVASVARSYGAEVPFRRPRELADDLTGTTAVMRHALGALAADGVQVGLACCLYATAPMLLPSDVVAGREALERSDAQFAITVTTFPFPPQRAVVLTERGRLRMLHPELERARSQDLPPAFHDAGALYWGRPRAFVEGLSIFAEHTVPVMLPRHRVQDLDTLEDWERAELMYRAWRASPPPPDAA